MTLTLTPSQEQASKAFLKFLADPSQKFFGITGYAGCGKTTLLNHLIDTLYERVKMLTLVNATDYKGIDVYLAATTNKAVSVVAEGSKDLEDRYGDLPVVIEQPQTIHSLLGLTLRIDYRSGKQVLTQSAHAPNLVTKPGYLTIVAIDESSFIDGNLMNHINDFAVGNTKFLFLGDEYQLAPPGEDTSRPIVFDLDIPMARLTEIMRNTGQITALSQAYRQKVADFRKPWPRLIANQQDVVYCNGDEFRQQVDYHFGTPERAEQARILAWTNERVKEYNHYIRSNLYGYTDSHIIRRNERMVLNNMVRNSGYSIDDTVLITDVSLATQTIPNPLTNGGTTIEGMKVHFNHGTREFFSPFDWKEVKKALEPVKKAKAWDKYYEVMQGWADLRPAHASTVHKAQGSTYQHVLVDLDDIGRCFKPEDLARLLYVAMSRPRQTLYLYGELPQRYGGKPRVQSDGSLRESGTCESGQ